MGFPALRKLQNKDIGALIVFCLIGLLAGSAIPDPIWAAYTAFLVGYHLSLCWLLFMSDTEAERPIPLEIIIPIQMAFVVLVIVVVAARHSLLYFGWFPYPMAAMATWLLLSAVGYEKEIEETIGPRRVRSMGIATHDRKLR